MGGNVPLNPELSTMAGLNSQLALGTCVAEVQAGSYTHQVFVWVMGIQTLVLLLI